MALANNPLLTALTAAKAQKASAANSAKALDPVKDSTSSFSRVFAKQATAKPSSVDDSPPKPVTAKSPSAGKKDSVSHPSAAADKPVAGNGNDLPAKASGAKASHDKADDVDDDVPAVADGTAPPAATDPASAPAVAAAPPPQEPSPAVVDPAALAATVPVIPPPVVEAITDATDDAFDPSADPLQGLTAVQVALESKTQQAGQANGAANDAAKTAGKQDPNADLSQLLSGNLAAQGDQSVDKGTTEGGDGAFSGLLADGLKDVKAASSDTRVDNFAERLAALSQAAQVKTGSATPAPLLNQPLVMNQNGWTEGVVNRVMYLSSQNLKQADIQLEPAELGRLDIRVNMAADQQTQVTFMSAHVGVREALESQMSRLRDSFVQQGMGQVDVNVSDQSRGWQQQAQQQSGGDGQRGSGTSAAGGVNGSDLIADGAPVDAATAAASAPLTVIGSSAVDYYA